MARIGVVLVVVAAVGCGGGGAADAPRLPHALGASLAAQASAVEASLARGDACAAAGQATQLQEMAASAIASGQVPATLRAPLSSSVASLVDEITCVPPPPGPGPPDKKHGDDKKRGHGHDEDGGGD
jgi:hypothetical protein